MYNTDDYSVVSSLEYPSAITSIGLSVCSCIFLSDNSIKILVNFIDIIKRKKFEKFYQVDNLLLVL